MPFFKRTKKNAHSAQKYLNIEEIRDGVVVLKNGTFRSIIMASSINFDLKSTDEQNAIIFAYQEFINSLDFPIQIIVNSRRLDITPYLNDLKEKERVQKNELLQIQTHDYREYVEKLVEFANVMNKNFYIVVPYAPVETKKKGILDKVFGFFEPKGIASKIRAIDFERHKEQLWQRVAHIQSGLAPLSIKTAPLNTQELIELFYVLYNPQPIGSEGLADIEALNISDGASEIADAEKIERGETKTIQELIRKS